MNPIHYVSQKILIVFAVAAVLVPGLSSASRLQAPVPKIVSDSGVIHAVKIHQVKHGIEVTGIINKRFPSRHIKFGHVHIDLLSEDGALLGSEQVDVAPMALHTNRNSHPFRTVLRNAPESVSQVRVSDHRRHLSR